MNGRFIAGGRAILGWTVKDLAERASISPTSLTQIENAETSPTGRTLDKILRALSDAGIQITHEGVIQRSSIRTISQGGWYLSLLDDVLWSLRNKPNKELLIAFADDRMSPPPVIDKYRELRAAGITMRQLICEGNEHLYGPVSEYRWIPQEFYKNWVTLIYGDCIAMSADARRGCTIITDHDIAELERLKFNLLWSQLPTPQKSIADVQF